MKGKKSLKKCNWKRSTSFFLMLVFLVSSVNGIKVDAADYWMGACAGRVVLDSGTLNIRQTASTSSQKVGYLKNGDYIMIVGTYSDFYKVMYDTRGYYGYVAKEFVQIQNTSYFLTPLIDSGTLNMRKGPGSAYGIVGSVPKDTDFGCIADDTNHPGWYHGVYANIAGFTSVDYTGYCLFINPD